MRREKDGELLVLNILSLRIEMRETSCLQGEKLMDVIAEILNRYEGEAHELIEVLLDIQDACGYLSEEAIRATSKRLGVPLIEVCRVASFYKAFTLIPCGQHLITVCAGTACHVRGAPRLLDELTALLGVKPGETTADGLFTLECVNCLGACALGPIVVLDGEYHHHMTAGKVGALIESVRQAEQEVSVNG
ncbi:MAG: NADH-quinone oxidoreductase subunit NuoE family protein [Candidatus Zipacnadales bacterium]